MFHCINITGASLNHESLHNDGITNVINWSASAKCNAFDDIEYMCIRDISGRSAMRGHLDELEKAVETIESIRKVGGRVLSHCWYGRNRRLVRRCSVFLHLHVFVKLDLHSFVKYINVRSLVHVIYRYLWCCTVLLFWWLIWWNMRVWAHLKQTFSSRRLDPKRTLIWMFFKHTRSNIWAAIQEIKAPRTKRTQKLHRRIILIIRTYILIHHLVLCFGGTCGRFWETHESNHATMTDSL